MALDASACAQGIWAALQEAAALKPDGGTIMGDALIVLHEGKQIHEEPIDPYADDTRKNELKAEYQNQYPDDSIVVLWKDTSGVTESKPDGYPAGFAGAYEDYGSQGEVNPAAVNEGGNPSAIESFLSGGGGSITDFAQAFVDYWLPVALTPGEPQQGVAVASIVNDADAHLADFEAAIQASMTDQETKPYFEHFILNVEGVVKTILWTITETDATGAPIVYTETIS